jgi:hypothetical protein
MIVWQLDTPHGPVLCAPVTVHNPGQGFVRVGYELPLSAGPTRIFDIATGAHIGTVPPNMNTNWQCRAQSAVPLKPLWPMPVRNPTPKVFIWPQTT